MKHEYSHAIRIGTRLYLAHLAQYNVLASFMKLTLGMNKKPTFFQNSMVGITKIKNKNTVFQK